MRILHCTDFHYRQRWFEWLAAEAPRYDCVCLTGDLLDMLSLRKVSLATQGRWVSDWIAAFPQVSLLICSGNHDVDMAEYSDTEAGWLLKARRRGVMVDGDIRFLGGSKFFCSPWLAPVEVEGLDPIVLLVHAPPAGTGVSRDRKGNDAGDSEVGEVARCLPRGSLVLSGHMHTPVRWTARCGMARCFNPGVDFSRSVPNHISIDLASRRAELVAASRRATIKW